MKVILSTPMLLETGNFTMNEISLEEAKEWVDNNEVKNYCGHETVRILDLEPAKNREECFGYSECLCLKPNARLEFGKEYTKEEIKNIGVKAFLIKKI